MQLKKKRGAGGKSKGGKQIEREGAGERVKVPGGLVVGGVGRGGEGRGVVRSQRW